METLRQAAPSMVNTFVPPGLPIPNVVPPTPDTTTTTSTTSGSTTTTTAPTATAPTSADPFSEVNLFIREFFYLLVSDNFEAFVPPIANYFLHISCAF